MVCGLSLDILEKKPGHNSWPLSVDSITTMWKAILMLLYVIGGVALDRPLELNINLIYDLRSYKRHPGCVA